MSVLNSAGVPQHRVLVAVPCGDEVKAGFAQDLALLIGYTTFTRPDLEVRVAFLRGTYLPRARASLVQHAEDQTATHILWLDADMRFPKDTLLRLLDHAAPIVAANYPTRTHPIIPTATDLDGAPLFESSGLHEVKTCGMGVMLTEMAVFRAMGKPYFAVGYSRDADDYAGEDIFFCNKARGAGFEVRVDSALSENVGHCGEFVYGTAHARMTRDTAMARMPAPTEQPTLQLVTG